MTAEHLAQLVVNVVHSERPVLSMQAAITEAAIICCRAGLLLVIGQAGGDPVDQARAVQRLLEAARDVGRPT